MVDVNGIARETPVGPPCTTTSSGYLMAGLKSAGLCNTPSMAAPSLLVQLTTSSVPLRQPDVCAFRFVSVRAPARLLTTTSAIEDASARRHALVDPSSESVQALVTVRSTGFTLVAVRAPTSSRYR